jgi:hypothetical protein
MVFTVAGILFLAQVYCTTHFPASAASKVKWGKKMRHSGQKTQ